jgi:hypothetical protein
MKASAGDEYGDVLSAMVELLESARRTSARAVNSIMTATYWEIGRRSEAKAGRNMERNWSSAWLAT